MPLRDLGRGQMRQELLFSLQAFKYYSIFLTVYTCYFGEKNKKTIHFIITLAASNPSQAVALRRRITKPG